MVSVRSPCSRPSDLRFAGWTWTTMTSAVTQVNSIRPRYAKLGVANVPETLKPIPDEKQRTEASSGLPGWLETAGVK